MKFKESYNESKQSLNEASLTGLLKSLADNTDKNIGVITAFNDGDSKTEGLIKNTKLQAMLSKEGYTFTDLKGFIEKEDGTKHYQELLLVTAPEGDAGELKFFLKKLGKKFYQPSYLYIDAQKNTAFLVGTIAKDKDGNEVDFPGLNKLIKLGQYTPKKIKGFIETWKDGSFSLFKLKEEEPKE